MVLSSAEQDLALLRALALEGGDAAMRYFGRNPKSWDKAEGAGPVTEADLAVDALIKARVEAERPEWGWLSEETADDGARLGAAQALILDPIDGTRAFAAQEKGWCVALALVEDAAPVAAAAFFPALDRLYLARSGAGATCNGAAIRASGRETLEGARVLAGKQFLDDKHWTAPLPPVERIFRPSLIHRFCMVAEGAAEALITLKPVWDWDFAPGALIAQEAGCVVTDMRGAPAAFNRPEPRTPGALVGPPDIHAALLARR